MKRLILSTALTLTLAMAATGPVEARGCIKGAIVGGVAGHMAHHGVLGAAGGCVVGHHIAAQHDRQAAEQQRMQGDQQPRMRDEDR